MALLKKSDKAVARNPFTLDDDKTIIKMTDAGSSAKEIGETVGRTTHSVRYRQGWLRKSTMNNEADLKKYHEGKGS